MALARFYALLPALWAGLVVAVEPIVPTTSAGLYVVHSGRGRVPSLVDVPELASVRSMSVRVEGDDFRVAARRLRNVSAVVVPAATASASHLHPWLAIHTPRCTHPAPVRRAL